VTVQFNRTQDAANRKLARRGIFQVSAGPDRALDFVQYLRRHRAQQKAVENPFTASRHDNQVDVSIMSGLHDFVGRVAPQKRSCDRNPIELRQRPIQIFPSLLDDVRVQIPRRDIAPAFQQAGGIIDRRYHVQQDYLRMEAARQPRGLLHDVPGTSREHNRDENFANAQHYATYYAGASVACRLVYGNPSALQRVFPGKLH
jgi:hypothetical protein